MYHYLLKMPKLLKTILNTNNKLERGKHYFTVSLLHMLQAVIVIAVALYYIVLFRPHVHTTHVRTITGL